MHRAEQQVPRPRLVAPPSTSTSRRWPAAGPKSSAWPTSSTRKWPAVLQAKRPDIQQEAFGDAMRVIIGGVYYPTLDGSSVKITRSASDPVPTCALNLVDNTSSIAVQAPQEILVLDDQVIANPAANLQLNPSLNPYTSGWAVTGPLTGRSYAQIGGGVPAVTFTHASGLTNNILTTRIVQNIRLAAGQAYTASRYVQRSNAPPPP